MQEMRPLPRRFSAATKAFISTQRTAQHQLHIPINRITDNTNNKQNKDYTEKRILSTSGNVGRALCFALCMVPLRSQVIYPRVLTSLQKLGPQQASRAAEHPRVTVSHRNPHTSLCMHLLTSLGLSAAFRHGQCLGRELFNRDLKTNP